MRSGPKALLFQGALFRITEVAWVKVVRMTPVALGTKILLALLGVGFFWYIAQAKGTYMNLEGLLGLLALHVALYIHSDVRIGSSGDIEESYEERGGSGDGKVFQSWVVALNEDASGIKLGTPEGRYYHWVNLERVAWARPRWSFSLYGLVLAPVFLGYDWLTRQNFDLHPVPYLQTISFLTFPNGSAMLTPLCVLLAIAGLGASLVSIRRGVELCASGGLRDVLPMSGPDSHRLLEAVAGYTLEAKPATPAASPTRLARNGSETSKPTAAAGPAARSEATPPRNESTEARPAAKPEAQVEAGTQ